jgi:hypothetical protein
MFVELIEDWMSQTIDELDNALAAAKRKRDEADLEIAAITAVVDSSQAFQDRGHRAVTGYLKEQLNCSTSEARRLKLRGRLFNQHPNIGDALGASRIGAAQVDLLANASNHPVAGQRFAEFAPLLTGQAEHLEYADFAIAVKHFTTQADPDGSFDDQLFHDDHRTASVAVNNGAVNVHASGGDPLRASEMKAIFDRAVNAEFDKDCDTRRQLHGDDALAYPLPRSTEQRKFDAMYAMFMAWATAPADGLRPEPLVNFIIDPHTGIDTLIRHGFLDDITDANNIDLTDANRNRNGNGNGNGNEHPEPVDPTTRRCATSTGTPVHPDVVMKAMLRGSDRRVRVYPHDVIINMGRKQRLFTGKARQAAQLLAVRCGHRGCDIPAKFCDIDHLDEWAADNGGTDQNNALPLCGTHDRWKHQKQLRGRRDTSGRIHLIKPDGTVIKPLGARDPVWADDPAWAAANEAGSHTPQSDRTLSDQPPDQPPHRLFTPKWQNYTWTEWTTKHPNLLGRPDPGWTISTANLRTG